MQKPHRLMGTLTTRLAGVSIKDFEQMSAGLVRTSSSMITAPGLSVRGTKCVLLVAVFGSELLVTISWLTSHCSLATLHKN